MDKTFMWVRCLCCTRALSWGRGLDQYYYGDTFFKSAGTELSPYVIQTILGAVSLVGTIPVSAPYQILRALIYTFAGTIFDRSVGPSSLSFAGSSNGSRGYFVLLIIIQRLQTLVGLCTYRWVGWPLHTRPNRYTSQRTNSNEQSRRRDTHCIRGVTRNEFQYILGTYTLGISRRIVPFES